MRNAFKMGASGLKHKKFRLVITILLSCVAFGLFGLADTFAAYNHVKVCTNSIYDSGIDYASVVKSKKYGVDIMSINVLLENESDPVVWRGPVIGGTVRQFWSDTLWDNVDYLFVDMPPGTGDVALTVFQNIPIDGIVVVTSPQDLVSMIVGKAMKMASLMNIPVLGLVENMSYALCPDCGKKIHVFGESHISEIAEEYHVPVLAQMPINPALASACDNGTVEDLDCSYLEDAALVIERGQK